MKKNKPNPSQAVSISREFYTMATEDGNSAEIVMYGDIVESQPIDWWTGEPIPGSYITQDEFLQDLKKIDKCKAITIRMNSCGGDASVSIFIHNRLREIAASGAELTCIVDGVAMSGGSLIMCACDTVRVNPSSLVMIHKCWSNLWGGYNADDLRKMADTNDAYDKAQVSIYQRKTGMSETVLLHMMGNTTYMTGKEAVEKGFANELLDAEPLDISASADKRTLYVHGRTMRLTSGLTAPDYIPLALTGAAEPAEANNNTPDEPGEGGKTMANTVEELVQEYPDLTNQMQANARAAAIQAEQQRLRDIDEVAGLFDATMVAEAKYGENACTAQELAYRAAQNAAKQGRSFLANVAEDANASGVNSVPAASAPADDDGAQEADPEKMTAEERMAAARASVQNIFKKEDK